MRKYKVDIYLEQYNKFEGRKQAVVGTTFIELTDDQFDPRYRERDTFVYARVKRYDVKS